MKRKAQIVSMILVLFANALLAQTFEEKIATLQKVFDNIVNAYGNAKSPPALQLTNKSKSEGYPASYISTPVPVVKIEEQVFDICKQMGKDSLNALAIIISHELAHYYNDHTWCTDYSYAIRNTHLGDRIKKQVKGDKLTYETQADNNSFYYSCIAGYTPFGIYSKLIDKIYSVYKLPATVFGYPSKNERKSIAAQAQEAIRQLYPIYDAGLLLLYLDQLPAAESCFDYLAKYFPSREIYNTLGIAKFLAALALKPYEPLNFIYPVDVDPVSRIFMNAARSVGDGYIIYINMLKDAKKQFEKAISLDPGYISSHINLACVNDALGNYQMALGNIFEAEQLDNSLAKLKHIKAIIQYHSGNKDIAETALQTLAKQDSTAAFNYRLLGIVKSAKNNDMAIAKFRESYAASSMKKISIAGNCKTFTGSIPKGKKTQTRINDKLTITSEITDSYSRAEINLLSKKIEAIIVSEPETSKEINTGNFEFIDPNHGCLIFHGSLIKYFNYKVK